MIDAVILRQIMPHIGARADQFIGPLNAACARFGIDTTVRVGMFLAQLAHESGEFRYMQELADGSAYDGRANLGNTRPEAIQIARVHASTPGRWWKGHGPIQITGYDNHKACGDALGLDLLNEPLLLTAPEAGCLSAAWFWATHGCNELADAGDFVGVTRKINGGTNGLADRQGYWARAQRALAASAGNGSATEPSPQFIATQPEQTVDPLTLISVFGPILSNLIPQVAKLFGSGSEVATRNVQTASLVLDTVTKAAVAVNVQEAVSKMQADPALAAQVQQAVVMTPGIMELLEVGGGIQVARAAAADPAQIPFWKNPAFVVTGLLVPLVYMIVGSVIFDHSAGWSDEMRSVVVTAIVTGLLGSITGFFLGSSLGSQKKTDIAANK